LDIQLIPYILFIERRSIHRLKQHIGWKTNYTVCYPNNSGH